MDKIKEKHWIWTLDFDQALDFFEKNEEPVILKQLLELNGKEKESFSMDIEFNIDIAEH